MDSQAGDKKRRGLNPEDFQRLLARLDPDPAQASVKYEQLRETLIRYSSSRGEHLRAEELADNVLDEIARKPDLDSIQHIEQFAIGVLRLKLLEHWRKNPRPASEDVDQVAGPHLEDSIIDRLDQERKEHCFHSCMELLKPSDRRLIMEYYPDEHTDLSARRKRLAALTGLRPGTLITRVNRLRSKLEECCTDCYFRSISRQGPEPEKDM